MQTEHRSERLLALGGVAFTALMALAAVAFPLTPGGDVSPGKKPAWLAAHANAVLAQGYVRALGALGFILLAVAVAALIRRHGASRSAATAALAGGLGSGLLLLLAQAAGIASALAAADGTSDTVVRSLGYAEDGFLTLSSLPAVILLAASGITFLRARLVPSWLCWFTLAGVPFALLDAASYDGGPLEPVGFLGLLYFLLWSLATGISLAASRRTAGPKYPVAATP